jgi:hypothetical protein
LEDVTFIQQLWSARGIETPADQLTAARSMRLGKLAGISTGGNASE